MELFVQDDSLSTVDSRLALTMERSRGSSASVMERDFYRKCFEGKLLGQTFLATAHHFTIEAVA